MKLKTIKIGNFTFKEVKACGLPVITKENKHLFSKEEIKYLRKIGRDNSK